MEKRDFFISYTKANRAEAEWVAQVLKSRGYTVYIQTNDIPPGEDFIQKMEEFMDCSRNFIAIWSKKYFQSKWAHKEFRAAVRAYENRTINLLLPIRVEDFSPPSLYGPLVYLDFCGLEEREKTQKLFSAVRTITPGNNKPSQEQSKPSDSLSGSDSLSLILLALLMMGIFSFCSSNLFGNTSENNYISSAERENYSNAVDTLRERLNRGEIDDEEFSDNLTRIAVDVSKLDTTEAKNFFFEALEHNEHNSDAWDSLGDMLYNRNEYEEAMGYHMIAADLGNPLACKSIGMYYRYGLFVPKNYRVALWFFNRAVNLGCDEANVNIGNLYEEGGFGVEQDNEKALYYVQRAVDAGYKDAEEDLQRLQGKINS